MEHFKTSLVLTSISAKDRETLTVLMELNNVANSKMFNYQFPSIEKGRWVVWYYADMRDTNVITEEMLKEKLNDSDKPQ